MVLCHKTQVHFISGSGVPQLNVEPPSSDENDDHEKRVKAIQKLMRDHEKKSSSKAKGTSTCECIGGIAGAILLISMVALFVISTIQ